jgi:hypothetical protein
MNPASIPDLPPLGQEDGLLRTILWVVLYAVSIAGAIAYVIHKLPHRGQGPGQQQ